MMDDTASRNVQSEVEAESRDKAIPLTFVFGLSMLPLYFDRSLVWTDRSLTVPIAEESSIQDA